MVAGERELSRTRPSVQPGGRLPAPEPLAVVQAFINTHYDLEVTHGAEVLASPAALAAWLERHGLIDPAVPGADGADLQRALAARAGLRELARANSAGDGSGPAAPQYRADPAFALQLLNEAASGAPVEVHFAPDGPHFVPAAGVSGAIGVLLAIAAQAMAKGSWQRLKICPGHDCDWAFYDHSRNQAGRWCSMSVCGGREKARAHYRRRQEAR
jgi:predicted RNA-binding Zn ribbon-like protein